jgi:hypothetical protein
VNLKNGGEAKMFIRKEAVLWKNWTFERGTVLNCICEVCGKKVTCKEAVGHHICGRQPGFSTPDFLEFRHCECEKLSHQKYPNGNVPFEDRPDSVKEIYQKISENEDQNEDQKRIHLTVGLHTSKNFSPKFYDNRTTIFSRECIHSPKMTRKIFGRALKKKLGDE